MGGLQGIRKQVSMIQQQWLLVCLGHNFDGNNNNINIKRSLTIRCGTALASRTVVTMSSYTQLIDVLYVLGFWHWTIYLDDLTNPTTQPGWMVRCCQVWGDQREWQGGNLSNLMSLEKECQVEIERLWRLRIDDWGVSSFSLKATDWGWGWTLPHGLTQQIKLFIPPPAKWDRLEQIWQVSWPTPFIL